MSLDAQKALLIAGENRLALRRLLRVVERFCDEFRPGDPIGVEGPYRRLETRVDCLRIALQDASQDLAPKDPSDQPRTTP